MIEWRSFLRLRILTGCSEGVILLLQISEPVHDSRFSTIRMSSRSWIFCVLLDELVGIPILWNLKFYKLLKQNLKYFTKGLFIEVKQEKLH